MVYSRLQRLPSGYSGLQQVTTAGYRVVTVGYSRLQQFTAGYREVAVGYSRLHQVTAGYQVVTVG